VNKIVILSEEIIYIKFNEVYCDESYDEARMILTRDVINNTIDDVVLSEYLKTLKMSSMVKINNYYRKIYDIVFSPAKDKGYVDVIDVYIEKCD
jgi:hypothetical protein